MEGPQNQSVRLITVPSFRATGLVVLLDTETLEVDCMRFDIFGKGPEGPSESSARHRMGSRAVEEYAIRCMILDECI